MVDELPLTRSALDALALLAQSDCMSDMPQDSAQQVHVDGLYRQALNAALPELDRSISDSLPSLSGAAPSFAGTAIGSRANPISGAHEGPSITQIASPGLSPITFRPSQTSSQALTARPVTPAKASHTSRTSHEQTQAENTPEILTPALQYVTVTPCAAYPSNRHMYDDKHPCTSPARLHGSQRAEKAVLATLTFPPNGPPLAFTDTYAGEACTEELFPAFPADYDRSPSVEYVRDSVSKSPQLTAAGKREHPLSARHFNSPEEGSPRNNKKCTIREDIRADDLASSEVFPSSLSLQPSESPYHAAKSSKSPSQPLSRNEMKDRPQADKRHVSSVSKPGRRQSDKSSKAGSKTSTTEIANSRGLCKSDNKTPSSSPPLTTAKLLNMLPKRRHRKASIFSNPVRRAQSRVEDVDKDAGPHQPNERKDREPKNPNLSPHRQEKRGGDETDYDEPHVVTSLS